MAINFDSLPSDNPGGQLIPPGTYYATIDKAEMKKSEGKPDWLSIQFSIKGADGKSHGKLFDGLYDSDSEIVRYKLKRFIEALQIPITGTFHLKDLAKIVGGKQLIVDVSTQVDKTGKYPDKSGVDVFKNQIYYPMSEASELFGTVAPESADQASPINADDATDAAQPVPTPGDGDY